MGARARPVCHLLLLSTHDNWAAGCDCGGGAGLQLRCLSEHGAAEAGGLQRHCHCDVKQMLRDRGCGVACACVKRCKIPLVSLLLIRNHLGRDSGATGVRCFRTGISRRGAPGAAAVAIPWLSYCRSTVPYSCTYGTSVLWAKPRLVVFPFLGAI